MTVRKTPDIEIIVGPTIVTEDGSRSPSLTGGGAAERFGGVVGGAGVSIAPKACGGRLDKAIAQAGSILGAVELQGKSANIELRKVPCRSTESDSVCKARVRKSVARGQRVVVRRAHEYVFKVRINGRAETLVAPTANEVTLRLQRREQAGAKVLIESSMARASAAGVAHVESPARPGFARHRLVVGENFGNAARKALKAARINVIHLGSAFVTVECRP